jgi:hypothetical protein
MWLINTITLKLEEFPTEVGLDYAILSHRWGDDEVLSRILTVPRISISYKTSKAFPKSNDAANKPVAINIHGLG